MNVPRARPRPRDEFAHEWIALVEHALTRRAVERYLAGLDRLGAGTVTLTPQIGCARCQCAWADEVARSVECRGEPAAYNPQGVPEWEESEPDEEPGAESASLSE